MQATAEKAEMAGPFITLQEVAEMLHTSTKTISRWVQAGKLPRPAVFSARCQRFDREEVMAAVHARKGAV